MRKLVSLVVAATIPFLFSGCIVQTLNPLFSDSQLASFSDLVGTWTEENGKATWAFIQDGKKYKLTHTDEKNRQAVFSASVGKIDSDIFMDLAIEDPKFEDRINELAVVHLVAAHSFVKVRKDEGSIVLVAMDLEWLIKQLKGNPKLIPHVMQPEDHPVITATTPELQQFVRVHASNTNAFKNEIRLVKK